MVSYSYCDGLLFPQALSGMRTRIDSSELASSDIILNMLLSYRDIQVIEVYFYRISSSVHTRIHCVRMSWHSKALNYVFFRVIENKSGIRMCTLPFVLKSCCAP